MSVAEKVCDNPDCDKGFHRRDNNYLVVVKPAWLGFIKRKRYVCSMDCAEQVHDS